MSKALADKELKLAVGLLKADPQNPRAIEAPALRGLGVSMETFGDLSGIVWNERSGQLVAGHQRMNRLRAAGADHWTRISKTEGFIIHPKTKERFAIRIADWDETTERMANLTANNAEIQGDFTEEAAEQLRALEDDERFQDLMLHELQADLDKEVAKAEAEAEAEAAAGTEAADDDAIPEPPKDPVTKAGDIWILGSHRLLCGDCRRPADVSRLLNGARINVAVTSPPYASQREYDKTSGFKPIRPEDYVAWFEAVQAGVAAHLAPDGSFFLNIKEHCDDGQRALYVKELTLAHVRLWGWRFVDEFAWTHRGLPGTWPNRFKNAWEPVFHFCRRAAIKFRPDRVSHASDAVFHEGGRVSGTNRTGNQGWHGGDVQRIEGMALPGNTLDLPNNPANHAGASHSAAFPLGLPEFFILAFSDPGDVVLDPFMGSGSSLIAAERTKRIGFGTEISPAYCDVIVSRWEKLTGKKATREKAAPPAPAPAPAR